MTAERFTMPKNLSLDELHALLVEAGYVVAKRQHAWGFYPEVKYKPVLVVEVGQ